MNATTTTKRTSRRKHDFYPTPAWATLELLKRVNIAGTVLECCSGDGAIASELSWLTKIDLYTNDIDKQRNTDSYWDATTSIAWDLMQHDFKKIDWCITNPPFSHAHLVLPLAYSYSKIGVAFLLRLSYLEPCHNRSAWLVEHPPSKIIVLPRISFTGDGKTDSVTVAWLVWIKEIKEQSIEIVSPAQVFTTN